MRVRVWDDLAKDKAGLHDPPGSLPDRLHAGLRARVAEWACGLAQGSRVLDIGCGAGLLANDLARRRADLKVTGMDISRAMLKEAARRAPGRRNPRWIRGDAARWPFPAGSMDAVVAMELLVHLDPERSLPAFFREARRVCRRWLVLEIKNPLILRSVMLGRRLLDALAPRRVREFALGLKAHTERIPIHYHRPAPLLRQGRLETRFAPWPLLPAPSKVYVLDLGANP